MRLTQLEYFAKVAESNSMTQAAKELYISQPALSRAISSLEDELGIRLLKRSNQGIALTGNGQTIYEDIKSILSDISITQNKWRTLTIPKDQLEGNLKIIACPLMCNVLVSNIFDSFYSTYTNLKLSLEEISSHADFPDLLIEKNCNIGLNLYTDSTKDNIFYLAKKYKMQVCPLAEDSLELFINVNNPLAKKDKITIEDLKSIPLVSTYNSYEDFVPLFSSHFSDSYFYQFNNSANCIRIIAHDKAATMYSRANIYYLEKENIISRHIEDIDVTFHYYLIYSEKHLLNVAEQAMINIIQKFFSDNKDPFKPQLN